MTELTKDEVTLLEKLLSKFGGSDREVEVKQSDKLIKQFNADKMEIVEPLYIAGGEVDGHGDAYKDPVEGPKQLVKALQEGQKAGTLQYSLFHKHKTKVFEITKSWVNEEEAVLEDGTKVPANQPLVITKFHNEKAYNARVDGRLTGLSIGALGSVDMVKGLFDEMQASEEPTRLLSNFIMTHKAAHVAYTSPSQGGAASLKNEPFEIMKSKIVLDDEQKELLEEFDEELTELEKAKLKASEVDSKAPSTSAEAEAQDAGVDNQTVNKGQDMSDELKQEIAELKKQLAAEKLEKSLAKYSLADEEASSLASALVELDESQREAVTKALDSVVAAGVAKVEALEAEKAELSKSLENAPKEENELLKKLEGEEGQESPVEPKAPTGTIAQRVSAKRQEKNS